MLEAIKIPEIASKLVKVPFKCFCCNDSGKVQSKLIRKYCNGQNEIPFICQRVDCESGRSLMRAWLMSDEEREKYATKNGGVVTTQKLYQAQFDARLNCYQCEEMHKEGLKIWQNKMWRSRS